MIDEVLSIIFVALYAYVLISTIIVMLLENRNPVRSFSWLLVLVFLPVIGFIFYLTLGQNYRKDKLISRKSIRKLTHAPVASFNLDLLTNTGLDEDSIKLTKLLYNNNNALGYANNKIDVLADGESTFEAFFEAIRNAQNHIHIEFFIFADDRVSNILRKLLIQKAKEGVRVRMIYDYWGSLALSMSKKYLKSLKEAGVYVKAFLPLRIRFSRSKINYRNHRKLIIIDGKIGFTGGVNVADRYLYGNKLGQWRDTIVRIEGAAVHGLQMLFLVDWYFVDKKLIHDPKYFPTPEIFPHENLIQVASSGPDTDWEAIMQGFASAIMAAKKYVYIHSPYFIPPELINHCIIIAALSGVDVCLMIPEKSDSKFTDAGTFSYLGHILEAGVRVFRYGDGFLHSKATVIDDTLSIVGSCNMDERSFTQNFEANVFIFEEKTALHLKSLFIRDLEKCKELTLDEWNNRTRWQRIKESFVRLFSPLL